MKIHRRRSQAIFVVLLLGTWLSGCGIFSRLKPTRPMIARPFQLPLYVSQPLLSAFNKQANRLAPAEQQRVYSACLSAPSIPVRVAVIDVPPPAKVDFTTFTHSAAVIGTIRSLACPVGDSDCRQRIAAVVPLTSAVDVPKAGSSLSYVQFQSILSGVLDQYSPAKEHLVIDVVMGWDPVQVSGWTPPPLQGSAENDPRVTAVVSLLKRASCMGAIVVASAGNTTGSPGPMIPAVFESLPAPTAAECSLLGFGPIASPATKSPVDICRPGAPPSSAYAPLVYAAGAVDASDRRLTTSRPYSLPRLMAFGLSVTAPTAVDDSNPLPYTTPLSGTSAAAAIVGAVAAGVWSAQPTLTASQVMELVYQSGVNVQDVAKSSEPVRTEFCLGQPFGPCNAYPAHRVVMCRALKAALPQASVTCTEEPLNAADFPQYPADQVPKGPPLGVPCTVTGCGIATAPMSVQLNDGFVSQPPIPTCPGCFVQLQPQSIWAQFLWDYSPRSISNVIVEFRDIDLVKTSSQQFMQGANPGAVLSGPMAVPSSAVGASLLVTFPNDKDNGNPVTAKVPIIVNLAP